MFILPNQPLAFPHELLVRPLTPRPHQDLGIWAPLRCCASLVISTVCCNLNGTQLFPSKVYLFSWGQVKAPPSWYFFPNPNPSSMESGWVQIQSTFYKIIEIYSSNLLWDFLSLGLRDSFPSTNAKLTDIKSFRPSFSLENFARSFVDKVMIIAILIYYVNLYRNNRYPIKLHSYTFKLMNYLWRTRICLKFCSSLDI